MRTIGLAAFLGHLTAPLPEDPRVAANKLHVFGFADRSDPNAIRKWFVHPIDGDDDGPGTEEKPLRTFAEVRRRWEQT